MRANLLKWDETLFRDPDVFELSYLPEQFDYRDDQTESLALAIKPSFFGGKIMDTLLRGPPATGKTTSVKKIFQLIRESTESIIPIHINCKVDSTEFAVFSRIYSSLTNQRPPSSGTSIKQLLDMISHYISEHKIQPLICLDDANYLIYQKEFVNVLYPLLRFHEVYSAINIGLIVIISDPRIDLENSLDVRVRSCFHPEIISFPPYSARELAGILNARVIAGLYPHVLPSEILDCIVDKCLIEGDVRLGLTLIKRSVLYAERDARKSVTEDDYRKSLESMMDLQIYDLIKALSSDSFLVLSTIVDLFSSTSSPTTKEVMDALPPEGPKKTKVSEILQYLDTIGLIDLEYENCGAGRRRFVHLHREKNDYVKVIDAIKKGT